MNRRLILAFLAAITLVLLSSCGNRQVGIDMNQTFSRALIRLGNSWTETTIRAWRDFKDGDEVQITTTDGKVYLTHYSNVVLIQ